MFDLALVWYSDNFSGQENKNSESGKSNFLVFALIIKGTKIMLEIDH